jgi:hypothetical protein
MLFHRVQTVSVDTGGLEGRRRSVQRIELDVGRTLAVTILGVVLVVGAVLLWLNGQETPAAAVFALGEGVVTAGLGIVVGEQSATSATDQ